MPTIKRRSSIGLALVVLSGLAALGVPAWAGEAPATAAGTSAPATAPASAAVTLEQLAARLQAMEQMNRKLAEELEQTRKGHDAQIKQLLQRLDQQAVQVKREGDRRRPPVASPPPGDPPPAADLETPVPDYTEGQFGPESAAPANPLPGLAASRRSDAPLAADLETPVPDYTEGQFGPESAAPGYPLPGSAVSKRKPLTGSFGPGFQLQTDDQEFRLQVHYESQIETRFWDPSDQVPANSGFFLPRQRIFFNGNITKPIEYEFSINRGFGSLNLLNAYINLHLDDRFELRFGRFFTPLPYDQYAISNYWLPTPERSVFTTNLSLNRQFGMMAWGYLFDKRLDYAAGAFNGSRNSFESFHNGVDFVGYLNARPFQESKTLDFARFLNVGTSVAIGEQDQAAVPQSFRIAGGSPNADVPGPATVPFLILNRDVIERGERLLGSVHAAYFYKGLSLIGEWQYGFGGYATPNRPRSVRVPFSGYYVAAGYFLTGEHVERRTRVYPKRPLIPTKKDEKRGLGAVELVSRVSELQLGEEIFEAKFADPNLWSNQAITTEVGVNWYWNEYTKVYMFWLHGDFADPVLYRPGRLQTSADMFWMRFQLYF